MTINTSLSDESSKPWYKEFWAWFVFAPLILVILACSITVTIAFKYKDDVVIDSYYQVGKMIDRDFSMENRAKKLGVVADIHFDFETGEVFTSFSNDENTQDIARLELFLLHPNYAKNDHKLELKKISSNLYRADLLKPLDGKWDVFLLASAQTDSDTLQSEDRNTPTDVTLSVNATENELWRLHKNVDFKDSSSLTLQ